MWVIRASTGQNFTQVQGTIHGPRTRGGQFAPSGDNSRNRRNGEIWDNWDFFLREEKGEKTDRGKSQTWGSTECPSAVTTVTRSFTPRKGPVGRTWAEHSGLRLVLGSAGSVWGPKAALPPSCAFLCVFYLFLETDSCSSENNRAPFSFHRVIL